MFKKLMMACMAIAAFAAFVIAPAASASPELVETTGGATLAVGASITGQTTGSATFNGSGLDVVCEGHLKGTVTSNSGTKIKGEIPVGSANFTGTGTSGDCTSNIGSTKVVVTSKLCIETTTEDKGLVTGCGANIVFDLEVTGTGVCKYSTASVAASHTTHPNDATVNVVEQPASKVEGGIFCPSTGKLTMDFDLTTTDGSTLIIQ